MLHTCVRCLVCERLPHPDYIDSEMFMIDPIMVLTVACAPTANNIIY